MIAGPDAGAITEREDHVLDVEIDVRIGSPVMRCVAPDSQSRVALQHFDPESDVVGREKITQHVQSYQHSDLGRSHGVRDLGLQARQEHVAFVRDAIGPPHVVAVAIIPVMTGGRTGRSLLEGERADRIALEPAFGDSLADLAVVFSEP